MFAYIQMRKLTYGKKCCVCARVCVCVCTCVVASMFPMLSVCLTAVVLTAAKNTHRNDMNTNMVLSGKSTVEDDIINLYYLFCNSLTLSDIILNFYSQS